MFELTPKVKGILERIKAVHGDRYTYDPSTIGEYKAKIPIQCHKHGVFTQILGNHLNGQGCAKCANEERGLRYRLTTEEFIKRAKAVHGERYDYSKVNYGLTDDPVEIICPVHGSFTQTPTGHLKGRGCTRCAAIGRGDQLRSGRDTFIEKAREVHGDKYNYDQVIYTSSGNKVTIVCPEHGAFEQVAGSHLAGRGCMVCGGRHQYTTASYIAKANEVHQNYYDYSAVEYVNAKVPVKIICHKHGEFTQNPNNHLRGQGCPKCSPQAIPDTAEFKGELFIADLLAKKGIAFKHQYVIPEASYRFRYDFYLPEYDLLIEYNGIQHYRGIDLFGGEESLQAIKDRDAFKKSLAAALKYNFIDIPYQEFESTPNDVFAERFLATLTRVMEGIKRSGKQLPVRPMKGVKVDW